MPYSVEECRQGAYLSSLGLELAGGYAAECVMHGRCDTSSMVIFLAAEHFHLASSFLPSHRGWFQWLVAC